MASKIVPLNPAAHRHLRVRAQPDFQRLAAEHMLPVVAQELGRLAGEYPLVFVKDAESGQFRAVALLGLKPQQNLFWREGRWQANQIPAIALAHPFFLAANPNEPEKKMVCVDENALVDDAEAELLITENNEQTPYLRQRLQQLQAYAEQAEVTVEWIAFLLKHDLLESRSVKLKVGEEEKQVHGLYVIDEKRLQALPDEAALEAHKRGYFSASYAHLLSLQQLTRLAARALAPAQA